MNATKQGMRDTLLELLEELEADRVEAIDIVVQLTNHINYRKVYEQQTLAEKHEQLVRKVNGEFKENIQRSEQP